MTHDEINFIATGGQFGKVRRAPTFTIYQHASGTFYAKDDTCRFKSTYTAGHKSLEAITEALRIECERRTKLG